MFYLNPLCHSLRKNDSTNRSAKTRYLTNNFYKQRYHLTLYALYYSKTHFHEHNAQQKPHNTQYHQKIQDESIENSFQLSLI